MPFPQIRTCIVCEAVRPEVLGKWTLLGFFGLAPDVRINIADFTNPISLCFVFTGGEGAGKFSAALHVIAPSGARFPGVSEAKGELLSGRPNSLFFMQFQAVLPGPGSYMVVLEANGKRAYETKVELAQGVAEEMRKQLAS